MSRKIKQYTDTELLMMCDDINRLLKSSQQIDIVRLKEKIDWSHIDDYSDKPLIRLWYSECITGKETDYPLEWEKQP